MNDWGLNLEFQSPDGDFVYSDEVNDWGLNLDPAGFNPLTGISSILTNSGFRLEPGKKYLFQSPDGDFVYSDVFLVYPGTLDQVSFNPLTGISSILT